MSLKQTLSPYWQKSRKLVWRAAALVAVAVFIWIATFSIRTHFIVKEWHALGGTVGADEDLFLGPVEIHLGTAIGHSSPRDFPRILKSLSDLRNLPLCSKLVIADLPFSSLEIVELICRFGPTDLHVQNCQLTDEGVEAILSSGSLQRLAFSFCPITAKGVRSLLESNAIVHINIGNNGIPVDELQVLKAKYGERLEFWQPPTTLKSNSKRKSEE